MLNQEQIKFLRMVTNGDLLFTNTRILRLYLCEFMSKLSRLDFICVRIIAVTGPSTVLREFLNRIGKPKFITVKFVTWDAF